MIRTVLGDLAPDALGVCDSHDHLFFRTAVLPGQELDDEAAALAEVRAFAEMLQRNPKSSEPRYPSSIIEEIIDCARWAPSGDNAQSCDKPRTWRRRSMRCSSTAIQQLLLRSEK